MILNKLTRLLVFAGASLAVCGPSANAFELKHRDGTLNLSAPPEKVVSYDLGVLDTLGALDVNVVGVPKSLYEGNLARFKDTPLVGTLFEPDYSVLKQIGPDLIIAGRRSLPAVPELSKIAPTVSFPLDTNAFLDSFRASQLDIARAFGKEAQAQAALTRIDNTLDQLHAANKGKKAAVLFVMRDNVIPHAPGDSFGYAYELTGTESVLPPKDPKAPVPPRPEPNSPEAKAAAEARAKVVAEVAAADPDWLLVLDRGAINGAEKTAAATLAKHPVLGQTRAVKENKVVYLDPNGWYIIGGGLNNMQTIADDLLSTMK